MFKVGDRVRIKKGDNWTYVMDWLIGVEATIKGIEKLRNYGDGNEYILKDFSKEGNVNWVYNSTMLELVEPRKIVVHCPTEAEANHLMQAYERKGWVWCCGVKPTELKSFKPYKHQTCYGFQDKFGYCNKERYLDEGYKVITFQEAMELLGEKVEKETRELASLNTTLSKRQLERMDLMIQKPIDKPFYPLIKKPMNTLRENIRNNFFKKEENKLATLVETVEEKAEAVNELGGKIGEFIDNITEAVDKLENAVDYKDKKAIKEGKKQLQELEKKLDDTLMKQLIVVGKKVFKE